LKSINKTEQQKFLENYPLDELKLDVNKKYTMADIACGYGTCTCNLNNIFKVSNFI